VIKYEISFDEEYIYCNGIEIYQAELDLWIVNTALTREFSDLESALKYCLEQNNANP